jgi:gliding motility-associated-like protein
VVVYNVVVTTTAAGCTGSSQNIYVTVYPTPDVNLISQQTYCNGDNTTPVVFTGDVAGTTYNWTNSTTFIGLPASGTGNIPSFTATNITNVPIIATIIITPTANGCPGTLSAFSYLVNPTPTTNPDTNQVVCNGDLTTQVIFTGGVPGTVFNWTNDTPAIGLAASGTNTVPVFTAVNIGSTPIVATISVTPVANGCTGITTTFTITVKPSPTVTPVSNQTLCTGASSNPVVFTGPVSGSTFTWTNDNTSTGLAASGADSVPSFTGTNVTNVIQTSTVAVMPVASGCPGVPYTFTISVNPVPLADAVPSQTLCNGISTSPVSFSGPVAGSTFQWTNSLPSIGLAASGTGNITAFVATNAGNVPDTATITVTPSANGCVGIPTTFNIIVNPSPNVNTISPVTVCNGSTTPTVTFTSTTAGTTFTWINPNTSIGLGASGADSIPPFTAVNTGTANIIDTITVTPSASGCPGVPNTFNIIIFPTPAADIVANQTMCEGSSTAPVNFTSATAGTTYTWTNNNPSIGLAASGSGNIGSFVTNDTSTASITATITVTPSANGCTGTPSTFTITVNPIPVANAGPAMFMPCNGFPYLNGTGSSTGANITYSWTASPGNVVSGANNITALGNQLGIYTLTVTNTVTGCSSSDTTSVFGTMPPVASFTTTPDPAVGFVPLDVTFTNTSINSNSYFWNWGDGGTFSGFDTSHVFIHSGAYNVILIATNGPCYDTATVTVVVYDDYSIVIPNIFSPNDDGVNDTWSILCKGVSQLHGEVFDRWGLKLYEWNSIYGGWDGYTTSGQHAAQGTYFYLLKIKDIHDVDHIEQGSFMLVR